LLSRAHMTVIFNVSGLLIFGLLLLLYPERRRPSR
jgi:hypothetical protein